MEKQKHVELHKFGLEWCLMVFFPFVYIKKSDTFIIVCK